MEPLGRFEAPSDNNPFLLEKVTWTLMGHHGKTSDTERWWMPGAPFPKEFAHSVSSQNAGAKVDRK